MRMAISGAARIRTLDSNNQRKPLVRPRGPQRRLLASGRSPGRNVPWSADRGGFRVADMEPEVVHSRLPPRKGPKPVGRQRHEPFSSSAVRSSLAELMTAACVCVCVCARECVCARARACMGACACACACGPPGVARYKLALTSCRSSDQSFER